MTFREYQKLKPGDILYNERGGEFEVIDFTGMGGVGVKQIRFGKVFGSKFDIPYSELQAEKPEGNT